MTCSRTVHDMTLAPLPTSICCLLGSARKFPALPLAILMRTWLLSQQLATAHASYPLPMPDDPSNPVCARIELQSAHQEPQLNVSRKRKRSLKIFTDAKLCVKQQGLHGR